MAVDTYIVRKRREHGGPQLGNDVHVHSWHYLHVTINQRLSEQMQTQSKEKQREDAVVGERRVHVGPRRGDDVYIISR